MNYTIKGTTLSKGETLAFEKIVDAENEKMAKEKAYCEIGSKQGIKRMYILIKSVTAAK